MKERELTPIRDTIEDWEPIEKAILELFRRELYVPLMEALARPRSALIANAPDDLVRAISRDRIRFHRGGFTGKFSAETSKELRKLGAQWDRTTSSWRLPLSSLPPQVRSAVEASAKRFEEATSKLDERLRKVLPEEFADKLNVETLLSRVLRRTSRKVEKTVEGLSVTPDLTPPTQEKIAKEYTDNLRLYIRDFTKKETRKLRETVQKQIFRGERYDTLVKTIQKSYGVTQSKAKFLARQETNLLLAKFKAACYTGSGITHYKWRSVVGTPKHPVRPRHKELNDQSLRGRLFRFDDPPVMEDGKKKNPGEDYNCRCVAIPVIKF